MFFEQISAAICLRPDRLWPIKQDGAIIADAAEAQSHVGPLCPGVVGKQDGPTDAIAARVEKCPGDDRSGIAATPQFGRRPDAAELHPVG